MPGYERAEVSAELTVVPSERAGKPPREQVEAAKKAAGETGLANEAGPETLVLAGVDARFSKPRWRSRSVARRGPSASK